MIEVEKLADIFLRIREKKPLVHHLTTLVTINDIANITLNIGAKPILAHAYEEIIDVVGQVQALVLNLGTLHPSRLELMLMAGHRANELGIPIILDPVGVGRTPLRMEAGCRLLEELDIRFICGNLEELTIMSGLGEFRHISLNPNPDPLVIARQLVRTKDSHVALIGAPHIVADQKRLVKIYNNSSWLQTMTGLEHMVTAVIAACMAVEEDSFMAAVAGMTAFSVTAELVSIFATGPASFKVAFWDQIYHLSRDQIIKKAKIEIVKY